MKKLFMLTALLLPILSFSQSTYKGLPVLKAKTAKAVYRIGNEPDRNGWTISPEINPDVLEVACFTGKESVTFITDTDSISCKIKPGESRKFYVQLNGKDYALTEVKGIRHPAVSFDAKQQPARYHVLYEQNTNSEFLKNLREQYRLDELVQGAKTDTERVLKIMNWVHRQWEHNGSNVPSKSDALTILQEAKEGKTFRCVEYGIVTSSCLNAIGLKSRVLGLKTKDVETTASGAGHVVLETYLNDLGKWVMLDGQWDAMPVLNGKPLNAVEFRQAIQNDYTKLEIKSLSGVSKLSYVNWIAPYLYYFDIRFDNREITGGNQVLVEGKKNLMLVPQGAKKPEVFQQKWPMDYLLYTNTLADFYAKPTR